MAVPRALATVAVGFIIGILGGCVMSSAGKWRRAAPAHPLVTAFVTTADKSRLMSPLAVRQGPAAQPGDIVLTVHADDRRQPITGFGAALTDASVLLLQTLPDSSRRALLRELFAVGDRVHGVGFRMLRVPIGASDFSPRHYTLDDVTGGDDRTLAAYRFAGERDRVALLQQLRTLQPSLRIMATPWSAPAWMKTNGRLAGGTLRAEAMSWYAHYLQRVVQSYDSAGIPLDLLSVQNEPRHDPADYPGMRLNSAQRAELIGAHLGPLLARMPGAPKLLEWDHNWDAPEEPLGVLADTRARPFVHGVAWHCYAGDVGAQTTVHDEHPDVATYFTECAGGAWAPDFGDNLLWNVRTLIIGATQHWARGVMLWNLALDPAHGPHLGGCSDCRGVLTIDPVSHAVTRNEEYYALAHASMPMRGDAWATGWRVGSSSSGVEPKELVTVSFANARGHVVTVIAHDGVRDRWLRHDAGGHTVRILVPARSVVTVVQR